MERFNIADLMRTRVSQPSFHTASTRNVRVEFRNMRAEEKLGPLSYSGDLVVTCFRGRFSLNDGKEACDAWELDQVVVPEKSRLEIDCVEDGTIQVIWTPPFAATVQG